MLLYTPFRKTNHVPFKRIYCEYFVLQYYRNRIQSNGSCFYILIVASLRSCDTPGVDVLNIRLLWPIIQAVESVKMAVAQLQVPASTLLTSWKHMFNFIIEQFLHKHLNLSCQWNINTEPFILLCCWGADAVIMAIIEGWLPPTRENYDLILKVWQISYPIVSIIKRAREIIHVLILSDWFDTMAYQLVRHGQNLSHKPS